MRFLQAIFLLVILLPVETGDWKLAKQSNNISVYTRDYPNSDIKEFKAITYVKTDINNLVKILEDTPNLHKWMENVVSANVLKETKEGRYIRFIIDFPWPFSDRDMILLEKKIISNDGVITYSSESVADFIPEDEDYVRMKIAKGKWQFAPTKDGSIKVLYQFYGDPAGSIPDWLVNMFIVDGPYKTLLNLRKRIKE